MTQLCAKESSTYPTLPYPKPTFIGLSINSIVKPAANE